MILMLEIANLDTVPADGCYRVVAQCREPRHPQTQGRALGFNQKVLTFLFKRDPCVAFAVHARFTAYKTGIVAHPEKLPPRPNGKVHAVARPRLLKLFWRLPVISSAGSGHSSSSAFAKEIAQLFKT